MFEGLSRIVKGSLVISNGLVGGFLSLQRFHWGQYALHYCKRYLCKCSYLNWFKSNDAKWKLMIFSPVANFAHQSQCFHFQAILGYPRNHLPTLATKTYTKSICNNVSGCYNRLIFSYVGRKNQPCSSITQQSSFVTPIRFNPDVIKPKYVSSKCKTPQLCAKRIGEFDGFCLCISHSNHQCFYLHGVSFVFYHRMHKCHHGL